MHLASLARLLNHAQDGVAAGKAHNERQELHVRRREEAKVIEPGARRVKVGEEGERLQREEWRRDEECVPDDEAAVCILALCMQLPRSRVCDTSQTRHGWLDFLRSACSRVCFW